MEEENKNTEEGGNSESSIVNDKLAGGEIISPGEISVTATEELETTNPKLQTEPMEVHKHPHHLTHKKKWGEYLLEFLMLFLAVFLGFLAEYQLEHKIEHDREKQYMVTLVEDLKDDISLAEEQIGIHRQRVSQNDSLIEMLCSDKPGQMDRNELYYLGRLGNRTIFFYNNNRTFEQMKYSGGLRLIGSKEVSNKIMKYYQKIETLKMLESYDAEEQSGYKDFAVKIFNPLVFKNISANAVIIRPVTSPELLTNDRLILKEFAGKVQYLNGSRIRQLNAKEEIRASALDLTKLIKEEYHLQ